ncbi:MAG: hypothetical protein V4598_12135 [Bdellovibrionota bacterium]
MREYTEENNRSIIEDLERGDSWPLTYNDNGTNRTNNIYVWKVDETNGIVYLRVFIDDRSDANIYLKLSVAQNTTILNNLLVHKCAKDYDSVNIGGSSITATIDNDRVVATSSTQTEDDFSYRFTNIFPAYFTTYNNTLTSKTYDNDDVLTKTETFTYTIGSRTTVTLTNSYKDPSLNNIEYCIPVVNATTTTYDIPFETSCTTDDTAGPAGFDPQVDLIGY